MRIFYKEEGSREKVNFVDENNILLGYDTTDDCCAHGGWFISDNENDWLEDYEEKSMELAGWNFDTDYFVEYEDNYDYKSYVRFRLCCGGGRKFLTLYNFHNGYYSKGFKMIDDKSITIKEGDI